MNTNELKPIGVIHSPYRKREEAPPQGKDESSEIEVFSEYEDGLKDIEGFSHLHIFYWLHQSPGYSLSVKTPWDETLHGVFATRAPNRPNPLGYSVAELIQRKGNILTVRGLDAVDGTPVVDMKPYIAQIDSKSEVKDGWLDERDNFFRPKVYEYRTSTAWVGEKEGSLTAPERHRIKIGCPPEFGGKPEYWTPEHLFVASVEVCIMTTFLWLLGKENREILSYESEAVGKAHMVGSEFKFTEIEVRPLVVATNEREVNRLHDLLQSAREQCLVSKSLKCKVVLNPLVREEN